MKSEQDKEKAKLRRLVSSAKYWLTKCLKYNGRIPRSELEPYVLSRINMRTKRDGTVKHVTKPIHLLAFILAYNKLEADGQIEIERGSRTPFLMTDFETLFTLRDGKDGTS